MDVKFLKIAIKITYFFAGMFVIQHFGCLNAPDLSAVPEITAVGLSKNFMNQGSLNNDSIIFSIEFTDGDGNFGTVNTSNIFIEDSRKPGLIYEYKAPTIPEQGINNGIKATIYLTFYSICCFTENNPSCCLDNFGCPSSNEFHFTVWILDRDNNKSNLFVTEDIVLSCI